MWEEGHKGAKQRNMRKKSCIDDYKQRRPSYVPGVHSLAFHTAVFVFLSFTFCTGRTRDPDGVYRCSLGRMN